MILPDTWVWINHLRIWRRFDFLKLLSPQWLFPQYLGVMLWAGLYVSFWIQACSCSCSFYPTASIFIAAPLSGKQFHHNFWLLVFLLEWAHDKLHHPRGLFLPAVFELLYYWPASPTWSPCALHFCTNAIFLVSPWLCLPASHLPLGKLSAVSEIAQSARCPNSEECLPHSQLKGIRLRKTSPMAT